MASSSGAPCRGSSPATRWGACPFRLARASRRLEGVRGDRDSRPAPQSERRRDHEGAPGVFPAVHPTAASRTSISGSSPGKGSGTPWALSHRPRGSRGNARLAGLPGRRSRRLYRRCRADGGPVRHAVRLRVGRHPRPHRAIGSIMFRSRSRSIGRACGRTRRRARAELLKHEQGHYDIVALIARDLFNELTGWDSGKSPKRFRKETDLKNAADRLRRQAKSLAARLSGTATTVGVYDKQTRHMQDTKAQERMGQGAGGGEVEREPADVGAQRDGGGAVARVTRRLSRDGAPRSAYRGCGNFSRLAGDPDHVLMNLLRR